MRSCQTTIQLLFRSLAALILAVFVAAEVLCFLHCHFGGGHGDSAKAASCHGAASSQAGHDKESPSPPAGSAMTSCFTLQNLLTTSGAARLILPDLLALYTLAPFALAPDATVTEPTARVSQAARLCDWISTPEVCTAPANRSHAPPLS